MSATCLVFLITKPNNCWNKILHCQWRTIEQKQQIKVFSQFYPPEGKRRQSFAVIRWHFCSSAPAFDVLWGRCSVSPSFKGKPNTYIPHNYFDHYPRTWRIGRKDQMISFAPEKGERKPPPREVADATPVLIAAHQAAQGTLLGSSAQAARWERLKYGWEALQIWETQSRNCTVWSRGEEGEGEVSLAKLSLSSWTDKASVWHIHTGKHQALGHLLPCTRT